MVTAFVLIQAQRNQITEVAQAMAALPYVHEVYSVTGEWDIVAMLKLPQYEALGTVMTEHVRRVEGIVRSQTMLAFRAYGADLLDKGFSLGLESR